MEGEKIFATVAGDGKAEIEQYKVWDAYNSQLMRKLFSDASIQEEYDRAHGVTYITRDQRGVINNYKNSAQAKITALKAIEGRLGLYDEPSASQDQAVPKAPAAINEVFVVHGHDNELKITAARLKSRARQNVILELGLFIGLLGRSRVCALVKGALERPSDIDGVLYIDVDDRGSWKFSLANEMKAAGLDVDMNKVK